MFRQVVTTLAAVVALCTVVCTSADAGRWYRDDWDGPLVYRYLSWGGPRIYVTPIRGYRYHPGWCFRHRYECGQW